MLAVDDAELVMRLECSDFAFLLAQCHLAPSVTDVRGISHGYVAPRSWNGFPYPGAVRGFDNCVSDLLSIKWVVCDLLSQTSTPRGIGYSIQTSSLTEQLLIQVNIHENQLRFQSIARSIEWAYSCFVCVAFALGIAFCAAMGIVRVVEKLGEAEMRRMTCGQLVDLP